MDDEVRIGLETCCREFITDDYQACAKRIEQLAERGISLPFLIIYLFCLNRLGRTMDAGRLHTQLLASTRDNPWDHLLVKIATGQVEFNVVLAEAKAPQQRCAAYYYAGEQYKSRGMIREAGDHFLGAVVEKTAQCLERQLATQRMMQMGLIKMERRQVDQADG
jgi:hypothetical protein